jgi:hypothetical protein
MRQLLLLTLLCSFGSAWGIFRASSAQMPFWNFSVFSEDGVTNQTVIKERYDAVQYALQLWQQYYSGKRAQTVTCNFSFINETYPFHRDPATRETDLFYVTQSFVSIVVGERPFYPSGAYQLATNHTVKEYLFPPVESGALSCWVYLRSENPFYLGTDGNPPPDAYDLPTVILRASAIVLGFNGLIRANATSYPQFLIDQYNREASTFFDLFLYGSPRSQYSALLPLAFLGAYVHHQELMASFVTADELYFASGTNRRTVPRMYAPSTYNPYESIYFLRPPGASSVSLNRLWLSPMFTADTYDPADALMYPTLSSGVAIHAIGNLTLQALLCANDGCNLNEDTNWPTYAIVLFVLGTITVSALLPILLISLLRAWVRFRNSKQSVVEDIATLLVDEAETEEDLAFEFGVDDLHREYTTIPLARSNPQDSLSVSRRLQNQMIHLPSNHNI